VRRGGYCSGYCRSDDTPREEMTPPDKPRTYGYGGGLVVSEFAKGRRSSLVEGETYMERPLLFSSSSHIYYVFMFAQRVDSRRRFGDRSTERVVPLWPFLIKQTKISNRNRKPSNQNCKKLPPSLVFRRFGLKFQGFGFKPSNRIVKPNANAQTELVKF